MKIVEINVNEIQFEYFENKTLNTKLTLKSKTKLPVFFKLKTTDSQYFTVKPHRGILEQGKTVEVDITIKPITLRDAEVVSDQRFQITVLEVENKDVYKYDLLNTFYVFFIIKIDAVDFDKAWKDAEQNDSSLIQSQKLKITLYRNENGIKKFITNSKVDSQLKQSQMYQSVRSSVRQDNNLGSLDNDNFQRNNFEEIGKKYEEVEKKIRDFEKERKRVHDQFLKLKASQGQSPSGSSNDKKKIIIMAILGFIISYLLLR